MQINVATAKFGKECKIYNRFQIEMCHNHGKVDALLGKQYRIKENT